MKDLFQGSEKAVVVSLEMYLYERRKDSWLVLLEEASDKFINWSSLV